ncbi:MAG TPA: hypothetical protein VG795_10250 [Acidimicrobiia bacterium]|nr:hypothetical protein [Acidimicrobiia bacterium]
MNGALHRRQVSARQLKGVLGRVGPQHPGSVRFREILTPFAAGQRPTESELEDDFLELVIRRHKLPEPVRQHPVGRRRIDFAYPELVLGVETRQPNSLTGRSPNGGGRREGNRQENPGNLGGDSGLSGEFHP